MGYFCSYKIDFYEVILLKYLNLQFLGNLPLDIFSFTNKLIPKTHLGPRVEKIAF